MYSSNLHDCFTPGLIFNQMFLYNVDSDEVIRIFYVSGKTRSVRRSLFAQSSGLGSGVLWEWINDEGGWTPYETRTSILLEHSYQARQGTADLRPHGYNYIVDLTSFAQVNKSTGFRRQVRRQCNLPYPLAVPSGPACSCQQCLSHSSTGPIPSRARHSFLSNSLNRPSLQGPGRAVAAHPTSVYSPYPRRPLSVGGMSWVSPWPPPPSGSQLSAPLVATSNSTNGLRSVLTSSNPVEQEWQMPVAPTLHWHVCFGICSFDCVQKTARGACKEAACRWHMGLQKFTAVIEKSACSVVIFITWWVTRCVTWMSLCSLCSCSVPSISVQLNGSTSVSSALAGKRLTNHQLPLLRESLCDFCLVSLFRNLLRSYTV